jgi:hypothetical protein
MREQKFSDIEQAARWILQQFPDAKQVTVTVADRDAAGAVVAYHQLSYGWGE